MARSSSGVRPAPVHKFAKPVVGTSALAPFEPDDDAPVERPETPESDQATGLALRPVTTEDVDLLWDWTRQDHDGVSAFLGVAPKNSRELFAGIGNITTLQQRGDAWMSAIARGETTIGFVLVCPIQRPQGQPPVGTVHLYVSQAERGNLDTVVREMLADFDRSQPPMTLNVIVSRPEWAHVLEPLGFQSSTVLTRPALRSDGSRWA